MAEVLGPFGFAFGAIGFIFSTVGTTTEAWENFHKYEEHMGLYQLRLGNFERKINKWNIFWRNTDFGPHRAVINATRMRMEKLCEDMERKLRKHHLKDEGLWKILASHWKEGKRLKMKDLGNGSASIFHGFAYALWKKKKLESWMNRLKDEVEGIHNLSKDEMKRRTADFASDDPSQVDIERTTNLEHFVQNLTNFAQQLHDQCTRTPTTKGWALGLRPPHSSKDIPGEIKRCAKDVKSWNHIAQVNIELVYSLDGQSLKEGRLRVGHHRRVEQPQVPSHDVLIGQIQPDNQMINCCILDEPRVRTRPLGVLIHEGFFNDIKVRKEWQQDCARLLRGISNWTLLLWNTNWTQQLCCYGLQIEQQVSAQNYFRQLFTAGLHEDQCLHHPWRLRNLGLVLAQLALATPFRCRGDLVGLELEEWVTSAEEGVDPAWSRIYVEDILDRLLERPNTDKIRDAIEFCLTDESSLAKKPFEPGFLFKCIDSIHANITEWCDIELDDSKFYEELNGLLGSPKWPDDAYEGAQQLGPDAAPVDNDNAPDEPPLPGNAHLPDDAYQPNGLDPVIHDIAPGEPLLFEGIDDEEPQANGPQQNVALRPPPGMKRRLSTEPEPQSNKRVKK
ncbi:uncharacterized protein K460DRAFT_390955 [Cucurbitaria berberidis CBS 394.84]|uniref:Uncharacterized protein n=1 Tax=Cucurbitaria berberidis CBS 394.84 TaxID=1168544 RepID=A0A9P4GSW5_9PLEO|nr:uncharacterized protein K460DRAFT_390955 [Cucurbitaria berberidis CBS 394.84]KAF1850451.1 hypothetical protein K460DRAFT_390955 [Cucurbitaria berberidis CBS 394.84]